jgi:putative FmdB family regulatory protein
MPTYDYECTECGKVIELVQPITEPARRRLRKSDPRPCECDAPVARLIGTGGGIIFKGSGFYQTDYRSESYKQAAKAESESTNGKGSKDGAGKSDSTAPKAPAKNDQAAIGRR